MVRSLGLVYPGGVREKRRQPVRGGGAGASVRVGRKGCWVQGAGKRGGVMNRNDTVAGEYRAVVVYRRVRERESCRKWGRARR